MEADSDNNPSEKVLTLLRDLELRISRIESHLGLDHASPEAATSGEIPPNPAEQPEESFELEVGENWFAKVGIVVLALGVVFLLTLPYSGFPSYAPSAIGYVAVALILGLSRSWRDDFQQVSRYLLGGGLLLMYFTTLRLSYFSTVPFLADRTIESILLVAVVALNLVVSARRRSPYLAGLSIALAYVTALAGTSPGWILGLILASSVTATYLSLRFQWNRILTLGILLAYFSHFLWAINNPLYGNQARFITSPEINLLFVLMNAAVFAAGTLRSSRRGQEEALSITNSFLNGFGSFVLLSLLAFTSFRGSFATWMLAASALSLVCAVLFWTRLESKYSTFSYAMLGYAALSAALADLFSMPDVFVWLCWQSVLVLSTAVWFRSRFIVVANFVIYLIVFAAYLTLAGTIGTISISFGIVALLSARILNWRKDRLELKTEVMRNAYLASALFVLPYALYHVLPRGYVSASWLGLALFYYLTSRLLNKNRKYRWMALLTTILTVLYVFVIDLTGVDPIVRIVSFLLLGSALLTVSMIYSRKRRKSPG